MTVNLKREHYATQLNNKWDDKDTPFHDRLVACKNTSRVMFYLGNGRSYQTDPSKIWSDDDYFMTLLLSPAAREWAKKRYGGWALTFKPLNQLNEIYPEWLDIQVCGSQVSFFTDTATWDQFVAVVTQGGVIQTSGKFPYKNKAGNREIIDHSVAVVGIDGFKNLLLADPFGDYRTEYADPSGYLIPMNKDQFHEMIKAPNRVSKWAHVDLRYQSIFK